MGAAIIVLIATISIIRYRRSKTVLAGPEPEPFAPSIVPSTPPMEIISSASPSPNDADISLENRSDEINNPSSEDSRVRDEALC